MTVSPSQPTISKDPRSWSPDIIAGVLLILVALPLNLGVAIASGVPAAYGIISGTIGAIVAGGLSGCALQITGPDAGIGVLILEMINNVGIERLGAIVFICGLLQLAIACLRWGKWFKIVSPAVVNGMLCGMGMLIFLTQFHIMLDDRPKETGLMNLLMIPEAIAKGLYPAEGASHQMAAILGLSTVAIAVCWKSLAIKPLQSVPAALPAIITACVIAGCFSLPVQYVSVPANLTASFQMLTVHSLWSAVCDINVLASAGALALVASAQSVLSSSMIDKKTTQARTSYDRELFAQGCANTLCGILGVLPVACVLARSMANIQFGARTRTSGIIHAVLMVSAVLLFPSYFGFIPLAALAAVLVLIGFNMVNDIVRSVKDYHRRELVIFASTVIAILLTNLFTGVLIGFGLAILDLLLSPIGRHFHLKAPRVVPVTENILPLNHSFENAHPRRTQPMNIDKANNNAHDILPAPSRILLPLKNEKYAEAALNVVRKTYGAQQCEYILLSVAPTPFEQRTPYSAMQANRILDQHEQQVKQSQQLVERTRAKLKEMLPTIPVQVAVEVGDPCTKIVESAERWSANTILLVTTKPPSFWSFLFPSLSQRLVNMCSESTTLIILSERQTREARSIPLARSRHSSGETAA